MSSASPAVVFPSPWFPVRRSLARLSSQRNESCTGSHGNRYTRSSSWRFPTSSAASSPSYRSSSTSVHPPLGQRRLDDLEVLRRQHPHRAGQALGELGLRQLRGVALRWTEGVELVSDLQRQRGELRHRRPAFSLSGCVDIVVHLRQKLAQVRLT